jgi:hypothetical protein
VDAERPRFIESRGNYIAALGLSRDYRLPFRSGLSASSTETKKASKSIWKIQRAMKQYMN